MNAVEVTPELQKKILIGVLSVVGVIVWMNFFFVPQQKTWIGRRPEIQKLKKGVKQTEQDLTRLRTLEEKRARLAAQVKMKYLETPPQEQLPELLKRIAQVARVSDVELSSLKPKTDLKSLAPGISGYLELPLAVRFSAGYHQTGRFLDALEESEDLLRVMELEIRSDSEDIWNHEVVLILQAYLVPALTQGSE